MVWSNFPLVYTNKLEQLLDFSDKHLFKKNKSVTFSRHSEGFDKVLIEERLIL